jgi:hypothetical protein
MLQQARMPMRDGDTERRERLRYRFLERLYLLTGTHCETVVHKRDLEEELGLRMERVGTIAEELERLGYLQRFGGGSEMCITPCGVQYLSRGAWRRRSIRG